MSKAASDPRNQNNLTLLQGRQNADLLAERVDLETQTKIATSNLALAEANADALEEALKRKPSTAGNGGGGSGKGTPELQQGGFLSAAFGGDQRSPKEDGGDNAAKEQRSLPFWKRKKAAPPPQPVPPMPTAGPSTLAPAAPIHPVQPTSYSPEPFASPPLHPPSLSVLTDNRSSTASSSAASSLSSNVNTTSSVDTLRSQLHALASTHSSAVSRLQQTTESFESLRREHATLQEKYSTTLTEHQELQEAHANLKNELEALSVDLFEEANQMVASERKARAADVAALEGELHSLKSQLEKAKSDPSKKTPDTRDQAVHAAPPVLKLQVPVQEPSPTSPVSPSDDFKSPTTLESARSWFSSALGRTRSPDPAQRPPLAAAPASASASETASTPSPGEGNGEQEENSPTELKRSSAQEDRTRATSAFSEGSSSGMHSRPDTSQGLESDAQHSGVASARPSALYTPMTDSPSQLNRSHFSSDTPSVGPSPHASLRNLQLKSSTNSSAGSRRSRQLPGIQSTLPASDSRHSTSSVDRWQDEILAEADTHVDASPQVAQRTYPRDESFSSLPSIDSDRSVETIEWDEESPLRTSSSLHPLDDPEQPLSSGPASTSRRKSLVSLAARNEQLGQNDLFKSIASNPNSRFSARLEGLAIFEDRESETAPLATLPKALTPKRSSQTSSSRESSSSRRQPDTEEDQAIARVLDGRLSSASSHHSQTSSKGPSETQSPSRTTSSVASNSVPLPRSKSAFSDDMTRSSTSSHSLATSASYASSLDETLAQMPKPPANLAKLRSQSYRHDSAATSSSLPASQSSTSLRSARSMGSMETKSGHQPERWSQSPSRRPRSRLDAEEEEIPDVPPLPSHEAPSATDTTPTLASVETFSGRSTPTATSDSNPFFAPAPTAPVPPRPKNFMDRWNAEAGKKVADPTSQVWSRAGRRQNEQQRKDAAARRSAASSLSSRKADSIRSKVGSLKREDSSLDTLMKSSASRSCGVVQRNLQLTSLRCLQLSMI